MLGNAVVNIVVATVRIRIVNYNRVKVFCFSQVSLLLRISSIADKLEGVLSNPITLHYHAEKQHSLSRLSKHKILSRTEYLNKKEKYLVVAFGTVDSKHESTLQKKTRTLQVINKVQ